MTKSPPIELTEAMSQRVARSQVLRSHVNVHTAETERCGVVLEERRRWENEDRRTTNPDLRPKNMQTTTRR